MTKIAGTCHRVKHAASGAVKAEPLFFASFLIILAYIFFRFPSLSYRAEPFAEAGWLFYPHALRDGIWENLTLMEAGYAPYIQNILAVVAVKLMGAAGLYPYIIQSFSAVFIAFCSSFFARKAFRGLVGSDAVRFLLGLTIGFGVLAHFELYTFINFTYFGVLFAVLAMYMDKERLGWGTLALATVFSMLVLTSKPPFMFFFPVYGLLAVYSIYKRRWKSVVFYCGTLLFMTVELVVMMNNRQQWTSYNIGYTIVNMVADTSLYYVQTWNAIILKNVIPNAWLPAIAVVLALLGAAVFFLVKSRDWKGLTFFALCNALALFSLFLVVRTQIWFKHGVVVGDHLLVPQNRSFYFSSTMLYFGLVVVLARAIRKKTVMAGAVAFIMLPFAFLPFTVFGPYPDYSDIGVQTHGVGFFPTAARDLYPEASSSFSRWGAYNGLLKGDCICIPVNPYPQAVLLNCADITRMAARAFFGDTTLKGTANFGDVYYVDLRTFTPWAQFAEIKAISFRNDRDYEKVMSRLVIVAYDETGREIGVAEQMTPMANRYQFFVFKDPVYATALAYFDQDGNRVALPSNLKFFGAFDGDSFNKFCMGLDYNSGNKYTQYMRSEL